MNLHTIHTTILFFGASQSLVDFLNSDEGQKSSVHWYCKSCEKGSKKMFEMMVLIDNRLTEVEKNLTQLNEKVDSLIECKGESSQKNDEPPIRQNLSQLVKEIDERNHRKCNVVVFGLKKGQESVVNEIINQVDQSIELAEDPIWLGPNDAPNRPLLVKMSSEKDKWKIISKSRAVTKEKYKGIYLNPDLTKSEREEQFLLRKELRERRDNGEQIIIKKGVIVPRSKN